MTMASYTQVTNYNQYGGAAVSTHQSSMAWNGSQWVSNSYPVESSTHSAYSSQPSHEQKQTLYTEYYHKWKAIEESQRNVASSSTGKAKEEAEKQAVWAKYYAELSSRLAHHFYHNPHGIAPPELPPPPPENFNAGQTASGNSRESARAAVAAEQPKENKTNPGGLKGYMERCLSRCSTKEERAVMQNKVEKIIGEAIQNNTLHSIDWDSKELVPLPGEKNIISSVSSANGGGSQSAASRQTSAHDYIKSRHQSSRSQTVVSPSGVDQGKIDYYSRPRTSVVSTSPTHTSQTDSYYGPSSKNVSQSTNPKPKYVASKKNESHQNPGAVYRKVSFTDSPKGERRRLSDKKGHIQAATVNHDDKNYYGRQKKSKSKSFVGGDYIALSSNKLARKGKKKRKKEEMDGFERSNEKLSKRANRFAGAGGMNDLSSLSSNVETDMDKYMGKDLIGGKKKQLSEVDFEKMTVKGTCTKLEKSYLRLTAPPVPELVRPQRFLQKHLENMKAERKSSYMRDYAWFCSQFKAIRQDLTVQRISNAFAVDVYESHARVALEERDLNEFNQCQTQLKELYRELQHDKEALKNQNEFIALRLIYYVFLTGNKKYEDGSADLFEIMLSLTPEQRRNPSIQHALKVRVAVSEFNYHLFFRLRKDCPSKHAVCLMSFMVPSVRQWGLHRICKAYRPSITVDFVLEELGFEKSDRTQGTKWLESCGVTLSEDKNSIKVKESIVRESDLKENNSLI